MQVSALDKPGPVQADSAPGTDAAPLAAEAPSLSASEHPAVHAKPQWMHYGDSIRILGTIVVVMGHCADMVLYSVTPLTRDWWVCNFWDAACRWAVPIYIMLSGSLLLDPHRSESPSKFYHKRLMRIGAPMVFWSLFFMWVGVYYTEWTATKSPAFENEHAFLWADHTAWQWFIYLIFQRPQVAWMNLLQGKPYMHLHFIFRIAGLYAFTPLIRICLKHVSRPMLISSVVLMLVLSSADSIANNIVGTELTAFARFVPFLGYYLIGYLLRETEFSRRTLVLCWLGFIVSVLVLALGTGGLVHHAMATADPAHPLTKIDGPPSVMMMLYDFLSPVRVLMALCAWIVLVHFFRDPWPRGDRGRSVIRFWANTTLGLYLIHPFFREAIYMGLKCFGKPLALFGHQILPHGLDARWPNIWIGVPVLAVLVYVPSLISTIIIMRIPYIRRIAG